jgi:SIT4-associating protein SAP185/190
LHNVVYDVVQQVFNGTLDRGYNRTLALDLFHPIGLKDGETQETVGFMSTKDITDRVLDGQKASDESQKKRNMRLGYMGHLTLIAEEVCKFGNRLPPESLDPVVFERVGREKWSQYVEGTLAETRDKDNAVLGGVRPENAVQRPMSMGGAGGGLQSNFSSNTANTLANAGIGSGGVSAQDSLAMSEGTVGQSFEVNSGTMLSGFGDGDDDDDDDEDMEDHDARDQENRRGSAGSAFSEDEQVGELSFDDVDMDYR